MRILIVGFIVFASWAWLSTYIYVCKIKGLCNNQQTELVEVVNHTDSIAIAPVVEEQGVIALEQVVIPKELVVYFEFDKSNFNPGTLHNKYFEESTAYLYKNAQAKLTITGHTDALGTDAYNQSLGYKRALILQKYFTDNGLALKRISTESKGEEEPVADNKSDEGRAKNRRTVITIKK